MAKESYDLIVIGAGPGGYVAAIRAAQLGMQVACIEKDTSLGGTCLNVGCIPSKALLDSSQRYLESRTEMSQHGIVISGVELDLPVMMKRKDRVVGGLTRGIASLFRKNGVTRLAGTARMVSPGVVEVDGKSRGTYRAKNILIATGSVPAALPGVPFDGRRVVSSTEALALTDVPKRLIVVGGGAIGLELGSVWSRLGSEVRVVEMMNRLVPGMDTEMASGLYQSLHKQGIHFDLSSRVQTVDSDEQGVQVLIASETGERQETCDVLLVAIGRRPYVEGLGLEAIGIETDDQGRVPIDDHFRTSAAGVFAIGDVVRGPMLAHKAEEEGVAAVERMAGLAGHVNYDAIPNVVYTSPELASVGLTEEQATASQRPTRKGTFPFAANGRARSVGVTDGLVKVIADAETDRILGVHILGLHASDLIAEATVAIEFQASAEDLARSIHAHPTLSEAVKEAALAVDQRALHM